MAEKGKEGIPGLPSAPEEKPVTPKKGEAKLPAPSSEPTPPKELSEILRGKLDDAPCARFTAVRIGKATCTTGSTASISTAWLDQGATINTFSPRDRTNGPVTFNNRSNEYQLNQAYLRLRRDVNTDGDLWDVGGRVDLLYGTDSIYTEARGLEAQRRSLAEVERAAIRPGDAAGLRRGVLLRGATAST